MLTVTDGAGNPVSGQSITPLTSKEVVGPEGDDTVLVKTEQGTPAADTATDTDGVGYSKDFIHGTDSTKNIPACGQDNVGAASSPNAETFETEGTNAAGQCVVYVTAPKKGVAGAEANATRGEHTLNFQVSAAIKASATIEVAGAPASITTDAPGRVDPGSVTEITVSVWDDEEVLVGITSVKVRKVDGGGLIEDQGDGGSEMTANGQSSFTFIAPSSAGSSEILISAGDEDHRVTLTIGLPDVECADGTTVPAGETCAAVECADGTTVPNGETCPVAPSLTPEPAGAVTLTSFSGGSIDDLKAALSSCGSDVVAHASVDGGWVSYIPGALIAAANAPFNAAFADGVPDGQLFQVTNCVDGMAGNGMEDPNGMEDTENGS